VRGSERKRIASVLCSARREGDEDGSTCDWPCVFSLRAAVLREAVLGLAVMGIEGGMFRGDVTVSQVPKAIGHAWPYDGARMQRQGQHMCLSYSTAVSAIFSHNDCRPYREGLQETTYSTATA